MKIFIIEVFFYLNKKYGNYILDPPIEEQVGHHWYESIDLERSYTEYVNKIR
jgi:hypothetical protein